MAKKYIIAYMGEDEVRALRTDLRGAHAMLADMRNELRSNGAKYEDYRENELRLMEIQCAVSDSLGAITDPDMLENGRDINCSYCRKNPTGMMPPHNASVNCESGGRNHCTCDTCF